MSRRPVPWQIRGVEEESGIGRVGVVRFLCRYCRRYFRTEDGFFTHWDSCRGRPR